MVHRRVFCDGEEGESGVTEQTAVREIGKVKLTELGRESFEEDDVPELPDEQSGKESRFFTA